MKKEKFCIFINNYGTSNIVLPDLTKNNPGMGGTQYEMLLLCQLLQNKDVDFTILLTHNQSFEKVIKYHLVKDIDEAFHYCNENGINHLILRANDGLKNIGILKQTRVIYWIHNFINYKAATEIAKSDVVEKVVFVSQEVADYYYDHDISKKGAVIFNSIPTDTAPYNSNKEKVVAFVGDISPYKMLDKLTAMWPKIVKKVPDAKLLVLGSGDLYGKGKQFGQYGIAEEKYENIVLKPLLKHNLMDTVKFKGLIKGNMNQSISNAKVTVFTNPVETFCIAATDSIKNRVPVVCPKSTGYCDVVSNEVGFLYKRKNQAIKAIVDILNNKKIPTIESDKLEYLKQFYPDNFLNCWLNLFDDICNNKVTPLKHKKNLSVNGKFFVVILRNIRKFLHLPNGFSRIGIKWYLARLIHKN